MTIRHRITLLVVLMFVSLSAIGGYAVYQTRRSTSEVRQVTEGVVPSALASADLVSQVKDVQLATMTLVYAPDGNIVQQAQVDLKAKQQLLQQSIAVQAKDAHSQAQAGLAAQATDSAANYFSAINDTAKLKAEGKNELAQAFLFANVAQYRDELEGIVETLRIEKNREKDGAIKALNDTLATTTSAIAIVTSIAVILLTGIGALLYRQITRPLSRMQAMMSEIATNQDFTQRVPVGRMDEIGLSIVAFNGMIEKIQENSAQLKQKTADIQGMLQNMQQGILTVVDGAVIHSEYSAYLEAIFETSDIAGRGLMDVVFDNSDIGSDALSQVEAAASACLGEDVMNFEFNQHLLVTEIARRLPDGRTKTLDLSWSAITDDDDVIVRLMLCVRDVTEFRALAAEAGEQKRRLDMIGEILAVSQDQFHRFIESSADFVSESERIIRQHPKANGDAIAELFRNMHTIKGNARTYKFDYLTNIVHETEQSYDELRKGDSSRDWDQERLILELTRVKEAIESYSTISEVSLGRTRTARQDIEKHLMVDMEHIQESLRRLEMVNPSSLDELNAMRVDLRKTFQLLGTQSLEQTLAGVLESLPSLAAQLGKPSPVVRIHDHHTRVKSSVGEPLRNVFMHLLRNSLDHGIEGAEERRAQKKAPSGIISIAVKLTESSLEIALSDDGRGLALARIRRTAIEKGWIAEQQQVSDAEIAQFIFSAGFSTASEVTDVSGRGVGMDAVREFIERENGKIELQFTDNHTGADYRQFRTVVVLPAHAAMQTVVDVESGLVATA